MSEVGLVGNRGSLTVLQYNTVKSTHRDRPVANAGSKGFA